MKPGTRVLVFVIDGDGLTAKLGVILARCAMWGGSLVVRFEDGTVGIQPNGQASQ